MPRRKALKTGSRTRGRGHKKGRGAGLRGGRGNAGCHKTKRIMYERVGRVWGAHGFKRPQTVVMANNAINLKIIEESAAEWVDQGNASKNGNTASVYFSRTFPEIIANINTKLITYTCLIFFHFLILITHPSFDTLFH